MPRGGEGAKKESKKPHAKAMVRGEHKKRRSSRNQRHKAKEEGRQPNLGEEWFGTGRGGGGCRLGIPSLSCPFLTPGSGAHEAEARDVAFNRRGSD